MTAIVRVIRDRVLQRALEAEHPDHKRQRYEIAGPGGRFRVQLSHYRNERSAKRWRVSLLERKRRRWLCFGYWEWWCRKRHSNLSRLVKARAVFEQMKTEAEGLAEA